jgi:signal transduction histidine kinase
MSDPRDLRIATLEREVAQLTEQHAAASRELEAMTYAVSHDLRAPLRSLSGFSQALVETLDGQDVKSRHYLERIQQASRKLSELLDALLALSRIARAELHPRSLDLTQLCVDAAAAAKAKYPERHIAINIAPDLRAFADQRLLRSALDALLENALKFSAKRTHTVIDIGSVAANTFFVADNGVGLDMTYADKLFKPFQRLHLDTEYPGVGLGLALVQRVAARHNGRAWLTSEPDKGTRVLIGLNLAQGTSAPQSL